MDNKLLQKLLEKEQNSQISGQGVYKQVFIENGQAFLKYKKCVWLNISNFPFHVAPLQRDFMQLKKQIDLSIKQGAQTPRMLQEHIYYMNKKKKLLSDYIEVQEAAPGVPLPSYESTKDTFLNSVPKQHYAGLLNTFKVLDTNGILIDFSSPGNILYDNATGFWVIDLNLKSAARTKQTLHENINDYCLTHDPERIMVQLLDRTLECSYNSALTKPNETERKR